MQNTVVVVPCYNEGHRLDTGRFEGFLRQHEDIRFIFVDDGSSDDTLRLLRTLKSTRAGQVEVLEFTRNRGKAEAIRQGILHAASSTADFVGFWDADLATPLEDILVFRRILEEEPTFDVIIGSRVKLLGRTIERKATRHYIGRIFATLVSSIILRIPIYDIQCGAKLFRGRPDIFGLFREPFTSRWIFDVEIFARMIRDETHISARPARDRIYEHPLIRWQDVGGSKARALDFARAAFQALGLFCRYSLRYRAAESVRPRDGFKEGNSDIAVPANEPRRLWAPTGCAAPKRAVSGAHGDERRTVTAGIASTDGYRSPIPAEVGLPVPFADR